MARTWWPLMVVVAVTFGAAQLRAADAGQPKGSSRRVPMAMDDIVQRLGADNAMTDEQKTKVQAVNDDFTKKMEDANKKEGVAASQEAYTKAREARDYATLKSAREKLNAALGFDPYEEYKKALTPILSAAQMTKLFPPRTPRTGGRKPGGQ